MSRLLVAALLTAACATTPPRDPGAYIDAARPILFPMTDTQIWDVGKWTCDQLSADWTMENAAAAMMNSGAGSDTVLDLLDVMTAHACPEHRATYERWVTDLATS